MPQVSEVEGQWYDVCNDYSLWETKRPKNLSCYTDRLFLVEGQNVTVYTHKKYNEIHYAFGKKGLNNKHILF